MIAIASGNRNPFIPICRHRRSQSLFTELAREPVLRDSQLLVMTKQQ
jgi:hypothetical protein